MADVTTKPGILELLEDGLKHLDDGLAVLQQLGLLQRLGYLEDLYIIINKLETFLEALKK